MAIRLGLVGSGTAKTVRSLLISLGFSLALGVWAPLSKGVGFLDPVVLGSYACLGVILAAPLAAAPMDADRPKFTHLAARIGVSVGYGVAISIFLLVAGIISVYSTRIVVVGPDLTALAECLLFGLTLSAAVSTVVACTAIVFSSAAGKMASRAIFMGLLLAFLEWSSSLPEVALTGSAIAGTLAAGMLWLLHRRLGNDRGSGPSAVRSLQ